MFCQKTYFLADMEWHKYQRNRPIQNAETRFIVENSEKAPPAPFPPPSEPAAPERLNPFADDVCTGPFGVEENRTVPGLNADILDQLTTSIDERQSSAGRVGGQPLLLQLLPG